MRKLILFQTILLWLLVSSCDTHKFLFKTAEGKNAKTEVKIMFSGCCGCESVYASKYVGKRMQEQFIHEYNCGFGQPTKFLFKYTESGQMYIGSRMIAVFDSSYTIGVTAFEKTIFRKLDAGEYGQKVLQDKKRYADITGFRAPKESEKLHPFAINKKDKAIF